MDHPKQPSAFLRKAPLNLAFSIFITTFITLWPGACSLAQQPKFGIVMHGGAGTILKKNMTDSLEELYNSKLGQAIEAGYSRLKAGEPAEKAVVTAIKVLEDSPLFNAGRGSVYTHEKTHEMDASIMVGNNLTTGAVAGVTGIKNPILAALAVRDNSPHVLLSGPGATEFAVSQGLDTMPPAYFDTPRRLQSLKRMLKAEKDQGAVLGDSENGHLGTVGAAALDKAGHLAAGTSTGGMTNKQHGRIGDSPIAGAGTWADSLVAMSCTGHGEFFIRYSVARDVAARMAYKHQSLKTAASTVINRVLVEVNGAGGLIAIDKNGSVTMPFNTPGMYRGYHLSTGKKTIKMYGTNR